MMNMNKNNYKKIFSNFSYPILIISSNFEAIYTNSGFEKEIERQRISTNLILQNPEFRINIEKMRNNLNFTSEFSLIADEAVVFLRMMVSKIEDTDCYLCTFKEGEFTNRDILQQKFYQEMKLLSLAVSESLVITVIANSVKKIEYVNKAFEEKFGLTKGEVIGKELLFRLKDGNSAEILQEIIFALENGNSIRREFLVLDKINDEFWVDAQFFAIKDSANQISKIIVFAIDITNSKKLLSELNKAQFNLQKLLNERTEELDISQNRYRLLTETTDDYIAELNSELEIQFLNNSLKAKMGITSEEYPKITKEDLFDNLLKNSGTELKTKFEDFQKNPQKVTVNIKMYWGDWVTWTIIPEKIDENGKFNFIVYGHDVTEHILLEEKLKNVIEDEKRLNSLKSQLIKTVSHEFKTPLTGILGAVGVISRINSANPNEKVNKYLKMIIKSSATLNSLIEDIVYLNNANDRVLIPTYFPLILNTFINDLVEDLKSLKNEQQNLITNINSNIDIIVTDSIFLKIILTNLLTNAIKYSPENSEIFLNIYEDENTKSIIFEVIDFGIGIKEEELPKIWDEFFRSSDVITQPGSGLGLSLAKKYANVLGGKIEVESKYKIGSKFSFFHPKMELENEKNFDS